MSKETKTIGIRIGALCDPIHKQLKEQGISVKATDTIHLQKAVDGFIRLRVMGCMGDREADRIGERLGSKIVKFAEQKIKNNAPI